LIFAEIPVESMRSGISYTLSKESWTRDQALVIPRGDLPCWKFIELLKFQITNIKYQTNNNDQKGKSQITKYK